jgi:NTE family protein
VLSFTDPPTITGSAATAYALGRFLPSEQASRRGVALCLSGGGYRAALFHLGALRRLNEVGLLSQIDAISSVSGGSILAAHLVDRLRPWPEPGAIIPEWRAHIEATFRGIAGRNIRTWPILNRLLPWNWARDSTGVETLAAQYERHVTRMKLPELPSRPRFLINATDVSFGVNWIFDSLMHDGLNGRAGDYQAGYLRPLPDWPLARAVAASSCFPPVFNPLPLRLDPGRLTGGSYQGPDRDRIVAGLRLSDGGMYDNLGLEPVWKTYRAVLVSDGGAVFEPEADRGIFWRLQRYVTIVDSQARALRKRWLISSFLRGDLAGAYWGIRSVAAHYEHSDPRRAYSESLVREIIAKVRTDLDAFSEAEMAVLINHGYVLAETAVRRHVLPLVQTGVLPGLTLTSTPAEIPFPAWMDEPRVRRALRDSHKVRLLGRRGQGRARQTKKA